MQTSKYSAGAKESVLGGGPAPKLHGETFSSRGRQNWSAYYQNHAEKSSNTQSLLNNPSK